jgi:lipopolysaccharide exporter
VKDIGTRSISAVFWAGGGAAARISLQLATQISLARILGPEQYGLFAIGAIVISFSAFFSDIGIAYGLIQKREVNAEDLRFVFTWQVIIGSMVTAAIANFSYSIAVFFGDIKAHDVVSALAVVCLLNSLAAPSNNMLKRNMNFRSIQIAQLGGYIGGYILIGLPLALLGAQVWALVIAWIVQATIVLVILYVAARHPLQPLLWHKDAITLSRYGFTVLATNVTNWLIGNVDRVIIARYFSAREVGLYATSYNVLQSPTSALLGVIQPVFFSASSRVSDDKSKIVGGYYALIGAITIFVLPAFASLSTVSETFVLAVYGDQWIGAAAVFRPLALAMPLFLIWGMTTPLLWTGGEPSREFKAQLPVAMIWIAVSWIAAHYSLALVGWAVCRSFGFACG